MKKFILLISAFASISLSAQNWMRRLDEQFFKIGEKNDTVVLFEGEFIKCGEKDKGAIDMTEQKSLVEVDNCVMHDDSLFITFKNAVKGVRIIDQSHNKELRKLSDAVYEYAFSFKDLGVIDTTACRGITLRFIQEGRVSKEYALKDAKFIAPVMPEKKPFPWMIIVCVVLALAFICATVCLFVVNGKSNGEIEKLKRKNKDLAGEVDMLNSQLSAASSGNEGDVLRKKIQNLQAEINALKVSDDKKEIKKLKDDIDNLGRNNEKQAKEIDRQKSDIQKLQADNKELKDKCDQRVNEVKVELNNKINKIREEASKKEEELKTQYEKKQSDLKNSLTARIDEEKSKNEELTSRLDETQTENNRLSSELETTTASLENEQATVARLNEEQTIYRTKVVFMDERIKLYASKILELIEVGSQVRKSAGALMDLPLDDNYHILKTIAKYEKNVEEVNMLDFYNETRMAAKHGMMFSDSTLASVKPADNQSLEDSIRLYFLTCYLEKFLEALVVLNESCAGLWHLCEGMSESQCRVFVNYRNQINLIADSLGLDIASVRLFDYIGDNVDLVVKKIDAGDFDSDAILEINNCYVFVKGGSRPDKKISVVAQI